MLKRRAISLAALAGSLAVAQLHAQTVRGVLTEQEAERPVSGAVVSLLDEGGALRSAALSDSIGSYTLPAPVPGRYRVRAERVGYASTTSPVLELAAGEIHEQRLAVSVQPAMLEEITAVGRTRCKLRPRDGETTARVWEEARKALTATALNQQKRLVRFDLERYERTRDPPRLRIQSERVDTLHDHTSAFVSRPAEMLARHGYAYNEGDVAVFHAPDAEVLLSDAFLDGHCFGLRNGRGETRGLVGLTFQPVPGTRVSSIAGVLWLDRRSAELRHIEYTYTGIRLPSQIQPHVGGRVEFRRLDSGAWIVSRWFIRMPAVDSERRRGRSGYLIREEGGKVTQLAGTERGLLAGVVYDSTRAVSLSGARVTLVGTPYVAVTSPDGRFDLSGIPEGEYHIAFHHPRLDTLGIGAGSQNVTVSARDDGKTVLAVPTRAGACPDTTGAEGTGGVAGSLTRADTREPILRAKVVAWWTISELHAGSVVRRPVRRLGSSGPTGRFQICGLPGDRLLTVEAETDLGPSTPARIRIRPGEVVWQDLQVPAMDGDTRP